MKVSIITVVLNGAHLISHAIDSVLAQTHPDIEYIVVDGESTDGTLDVVRSYGSRIAQVAVARDGGIYPAMNRGLGMATGQVIGLLNADDMLASPSVVAQMVKKLQETGADTLYADLKYVDKDDTSQVVRYWRSGAFSRPAFRMGWMPPHPTFYVRREVYDRFGTFDTRLRSAADYELMLRLLYKHQVSTCYLPVVTVHMRTGGQSNQSLANRLKANKEDQLAWELNGLSMPFYTPIAKPLRKLGQFLWKG